VRQPEYWRTLFKTYDVRGTVPEQLDAEAARTIGMGLANYLGAGTVAVGRDMRVSLPDWIAALIVLELVSRQAAPLSESIAPYLNVRPSNTEPLLRLNVEADTPGLMAEKRDELLAVIRVTRDEG
jgi:phosphomannomutase